MIYNNFNQKKLQLKKATIYQDKCSDCNKYTIEQSGKTFNCRYNMFMIIVNLDKKRGKLGTKDKFYNYSR